MLFDTWRGRYGDNPGAISERLGEVMPELHRVWVLKSGVGAPQDVTAVRPFGLRHLYYLLRASYVFANNAMPFFWRKPSWCQYVQTWHGSGAFKKVGWDIEDPRFAGGRRYLRRFARDVKQWDLLLTSNAAATRHLPAAFRYQGRVIEVGSPRLDQLVRQVVGGTHKGLRDELGVPEEGRLILYAPTWRDATESGVTLIDQVDALVRGLGPADWLLIRAHPNDEQLAAYHPAAERVVNVSLHSDVADLLLVTDVLVTDYSSIFYDFAVMERPMYFFCYDLEQYRDQVRGLYVDIEHDMPGKVVQTVGELLEALSAPSEDYSDWFAENCPHEDGSATDRVIADVFGLESMPEEAGRRELPAEPDLPHKQ